jgi:hypothetical protein
MNSAARRELNAWCTKPREAACRHGVGPADRMGLYSM